MLAPQSGADINGQMGMIQDVITKNVDRDHPVDPRRGRRRAARQAGSREGHRRHHRQFRHRELPDAGARRRRLFAARRHPQARRVPPRKADGGPAKVGVIEGQPGYHSTERVGGFLDAVKDKPGIEIKASVPGGWNVEGGNTAAMDLLQANPDVDASSRPTTT